MQEHPGFGSTHRTYTILKGMKQRCSDPGHRAFQRYGGRGIKICTEWLDDFRAFQKWALAHGYADDLTIDRIDNDGDYCPQNCRWVSRKVQSHNMCSNVIDMAGAAAIRAEYAAGGKSMRKLGASYGLVVSHIHRIIRGRSWVE